DRWPPNSPDLCPLDYSSWNELTESMDWDNITTKATMIDEVIKILCYWISVDARKCLLLLIVSSSTELPISY
ncbi:unnamed protein product, partial [Rotaria magnacalcarata]